MSVTKYVIVGTGARGLYSYMGCLAKGFKDRTELVGLYDVNPERARMANRMADLQIPVFTSYEEMIAQAKPHALVVTSPDATHAEYVVKGLRAGLDVFCEKPLCTTFEQVQAIRAAAAAPGAGTCRVTHNMRFDPNCRAIKQQIVDGAISSILQVRFVETLDRFHGADYFRRWHRRMANSGGLTLQKASHHFDFINWLAGSKPAFLSARGSQRYYGKKGPFRGPRCSECEHAKECPRYADVFVNTNPRMLYKDVEHVDGYIRDACVFSEDIDIPDTVHAIITYENGIEFSYALNAYAEFEGLHLAIEGELGCLELMTRRDTSWAVGHKNAAGKDTLAATGIGPDTRNSLMIYPAPETGKFRQDITPNPETGGHGGADPMLAKMLFSGEAIPDPLGLKASLEEGIQAVLIGIAVNESMRLGGCCMDIQNMRPTTHQSRQ